MTTDEGFINFNRPNTISLTTYLDDARAWQGSVVTLVGDHSDGYGPYFTTDRERYDALRESGSVQAELTVLTEGASVLVGKDGSIHKLHPDYDREQYELTIIPDLEFAQQNPPLPKNFG